MFDICLGQQLLHLADEVHHTIFIAYIDHQIVAVYVIGARADFEVGVGQRGDVLHVLIGQWVEGNQDVVGPLQEGFYTFTPRAQRPIDVFAVEIAKGEVGAFLLAVEKAEELYLFAQFAQFFSVAEGGLPLIVVGGVKNEANGLSFFKIHPFALHCFLQLQFAFEGTVAKIVLNIANDVHLFCFVTQKSYFQILCVILCGLTFLQFLESHQRIRIRPYWNIYPPVRR